MSETYAAPPLDRYRDSVTELMNAGEPFDAVEDAIDEVAELTEDAKAALWLLAFSLGDQVRDARGHLPSVN